MSNEWKSDETEDSGEGNKHVAPHWTQTYSGAYNYAEKAERHLANAEYHREQLEKLAEQKRQLFDEKGEQMLKCRRLEKTLTEMAGKLRSEAELKEEEGRERLQLSESLRKQVGDAEELVIKAKGKRAGSRST